MALRILVTGGTGTLGRFVATRLRNLGHEVRVLRRRKNEGNGVAFVIGDLATGEGIDAAVREPRPLCTVRAPAKATRTRPDTWYGLRLDSERGIWASSRSSVLTGFPLPASSIARCSTISDPSLRRSVS